MKNSQLLYVVRTDALSSEARVFKIFGALHREGCAPHVIGLVKTVSEFEYSNRQFICTSDRIRWGAIRHIFKFFELQLRTLVGVLRHPERPGVVVIANYDLLFAGAILRVILRRKVIVDLHEHYLRGIFRHHRLSRFIYTRIFSGVIFANRERAIDTMGDSALESGAVAIIRNFPSASPGNVTAPCSSGAKDFLRVGIVGGYRPGRFVRESIKCLDLEEFAGKVEVVTFGPKVEVECEFIDCIEHGRFRHDEAEGLIEEIDVSLVFYDPRRSANNKFCEPNRYYQSYNAGKILISFRHASLTSLADQYCLHVDLDDFESSLKGAISDLVDRRSDLKKKFEPIKRKKLVFADGISGLSLLLENQ